MGAQYLGCRVDGAGWICDKFPNFQIFAASVGTSAPARSPKLPGLSDPNGVSVFSQGSWVPCTFRKRRNLNTVVPLVHGFSFYGFICLWSVVVWKYLVGNSRREIKNFQLHIALNNIKSCIVLLFPTWNVIYPVSSVSKWYLLCTQ